MLVPIDCLAARVPAALHYHPHTPRFPKHAHHASRITQDGPCAHAGGDGVAVSPFGAGEASHSFLGYVAGPSYAAPVPEASTWCFLALGFLALTLKRACRSPRFHASRLG